MPFDAFLSSKTDFQIKNQIAANQARNTQLERDLGRLEQVNQQLLNSKSTLDALNQDYSNVMAYSEAKASHLAQLQAALENDSDLPTEEDAQALISDRGRSRKTVQSIPQSVLDNVEQSTGISSQEINKLMNQ
jgi:archaellum component FlaC